MANADDVFPLPTGPAWSEKLPNTWTFQDEEDLESYLSEVRAIMLETMDKYHYNSIPSFVKFYQSYKSSGLESLRQFYNEHFEVEYLMDSLSCVGLSVMFKAALEEGLSSTRHSKTCGSVYYASCSEFPNDNIPEELEDGEPMCPPELTEHVTVVLKFLLHNRRGHVIMDFGYGLELPVVVMEDGCVPQTDPFEKPTYVGTRSHYFRHATSNFVLWTVVQPTKTTHRLIYLKRAFQRLDLPEKRRNVNPLQAEIINKTGLPLAGYFSCVGQTNGELTVFAKRSGRVETVKIPYNEVLEDKTIVNEVLKTCLEYLGPSALQEIRSFVLSCVDEEFGAQLMEMDKNFRLTLADKWNRTDSI